MKEDIITKILYLVLFVGLLIVIGQAKTECKNYTDEKLADLINENNDMKDQLEHLNYDIKEYRIDLYDLWWVTLSDNTKNKIKIWEEKNEYFSTCEKGIASSQIERSPFSYEGSPAEVHIMEYEKGYLITDREGNINCYSKPILDYNPPSVDCIELCKSTEVKENEIL